MVIDFSQWDLPKDPTMLADYMKWVHKVGLPFYFNQPGVKEVIAYRSVFGTSPQLSFMVTFKDMAAWLKMITSAEYAQNVCEFSQFVENITNHQLLNMLPLPLNCGNVPFKKQNLL
jgi:hypothetical protein